MSFFDVGGGGRGLGNMLNDPCNLSTGRLCIPVLFNFKSLKIFSYFSFRKGSLIWQGILKIDMPGFLINYPDEPVGIFISHSPGLLNLTTYCRC